jgi:APA family basic amino acid/polyamine antiporter
LGRWDARTGTPVWALGVQGLIALCLILAFGGYIDAILYTAAAVYTFYLGTSLAVIVLRYREPQVERPYRVTGYPFTPLIFVAVCGYLIYKAMSYAFAFKRTFLLIMAATLAIGLVIYLLTDLRRKNAADTRSLAPTEPISPLDPP